MSKIKIKIIPRGKWVLVEPANEESHENQFGIIIPSKVEQEQKAQGTVKSIGDEVKGIKVGDHVVYGAYAGEVMKVKDGTKDVEYKILLDEDIIAFLK